MNRKKIFIHQSKAEKMHSFSFYFFFHPKFFSGTYPKKKKKLKNQTATLILTYNFKSQNTLELYGRCVASPVVKLNTEKYSAPDFPPRLNWHELSGHPYNALGAVLAAFELIEVGSEKLSIIFHGELEN